MASSEIDDSDDAITYLWRIQNLSYWDRECHGSKLISPKSPAAHIPHCRPDLHLFPKGKEEGDEHLCVQLQPLSWPHTSTVNFELSFLDSSGSALTTCIVRNVNANTEPVDLPDCPKHEEVFQTERSSFLPHDTLTVLCRLWTSENFPITIPPQKYRHVSACSRIDVRDACVQLPQRVLKNLQLDQKEKFSILFYNKIGCNDVFRCTFSLMGSSLSTAVFNFKIRRINNNTPLLITCKLSLLNAEGKTMRRAEDSHKFSPSPEPQVWIFPHFLTRKELDDRDIDSISAEIIATANTISEDISVMWGSACMKYGRSRDGVSSVTQQNDGPVCTSKQRSESVTVLRDDLLSVFKDQTLSDFQLCSGGGSFPVHKVVLSARSPVFRAMLSSDTSESASLHVPDVDVLTLRRMLTFLYSGTVADLQWEGAVKLYSAADKYQVPSLKEECSSHLRSNVGVSNVCDILVLADQHQDHKLAAFVHDFIKDHYDEILLSDEWDAFLETHSYLAGVTVRAVYKIIKK